MDTERDCTVSMLGANLLVLVSAGPLVAALALAFAARWGMPALAGGVYRLLDPVVFLLTVPAGIVVHELIRTPSPGRPSPAGRSARSGSASSGGASRPTPIRASRCRWAPTAPAR